ncbi:DoxX family protein [Paracoccus aestuariivivens]|nr:DoxX family protein [Paracoccus aestuariivivens]
MSSSSKPLARALHLLALLGLSAAYIQGGLVKLLNFPAATAEMAHFGLSPSAGFAVAVIVLELLAPALILSGRLRWLGALALCGFTLMATFVALRFWQLPPSQARFFAANAFFEHVGLAGGFLLVAWMDLTGRG